ncbi:MAG: hypothetical protein JWR60_1430 [Polaromonas sp.]|nr:hypothetical protein [Polaromonas sp.]
MLSKTLLSFFKESGQQEYFDKLFLNLIPSLDTTLYVLNAHLIVEELVFKLIQKALREPSAITPTDLNYQKKCLLLKGLRGDTLDEWLYFALASLGALRNKCAHVLDHPKLDDSISSFVRAAYECSEENEALLFKARGKGYSLPSNLPDKEKQRFESIAQQQHDLWFRLPMACERMIELLLRDWHGQ